MDGPMRPYMNYVPQFMKDEKGEIVSHSLLEAGIVEHVRKNGRKMYSIKISAPINGRYNTETMRELSSIAEKYGGGSLRFTNANNIEFFAERFDNAKKIKEEAEKIGLFSGGWGNHLWSIASCAGYFHCALAATDAPSVAKAVGNALFPYFNQEELPAKIGISFSGCPSACGGGFLTDISVVGIHTEVPIVTENAKSCDLLGTTMVCPVGCIQIESLPDNAKTIRIRNELCIGCGLCVGACEGIIFEHPEKTDGHAIIVGGKASASDGGTRLGRVVVPYIPNEPPYYPTTVKYITKIVQTWKDHARKGERISTWIKRIGWD
ncbi:MAG: dissimilatory-type sulfite reductase subunit beta, partial [Thermoplasmata archaeon]